MHKQICSSLTLSIVIGNDITVDAARIGKADMERLAATAGHVTQVTETVQDESPTWALEEILCGGCVRLHQKRTELR